MILDLEMSLEELKLPSAKYMVLPINASLDKFKEKILKLHFPLWIKINSAEHKLKLGGVKKVSSYEELKTEYENMKTIFSGKKFILQEDVPGLEIIAGVKKDNTFGRVLLIGAGGSFTELLKDTSFRVLPIDKQEILTALKELKIFKIIEEKNLAINSLVDLLYKFAQKKISEADLNPIILNENQALVVDARIEFEED